MQRWEYMSLTLKSYEFPDKAEIPALKELGEQGWELVSATAFQTTERLGGGAAFSIVRVLCCFKRPKK